MRYKKGYKYQLVDNFYHTLSFYTEEVIELPFIQLNDNELLIKKGYAWDGPSGPAWDTKNFMVASLVHDVLYQLMRMDLISIDLRKNADLEMKKICLKYRMNVFRADYIYFLVRLCARNAALPKNLKKIIKV